jgi:hypothetical protein
MRVLDLNSDQSISLPSAEVKARQPLPRWLLLLAPVTSTCALGVLGFAYAAVLLWAVGVHGKERDLALFIVGAFLLAPACAAAQLFLVRPDFRHPRSNLVESVNCWAAIAVLVALASMPFVMFVAGLPADFWFHNVWRVVAAGAALHVAGLSFVLLHVREHLPPASGVLGSRTVQAVALLLALFATTVMLFLVDPTNRYVNLFIGLFAAPPFSGEPGAFGLGLAILVAAFGIVAVAMSAKLEAALIPYGARTLRAARTAALCIAVAAAVIAFFDFSLASEIAHYLTNIGPALHLLHGGTLMVDTFSQYGPGPLLITLLGLQIGPTTFGTAQVTVQLFNLAYYAGWLICLHRMTRWKLPGLLLGIFSIAFFLAAYVRGYGNINDAPSVLGLRHVPTLAMVLALSYLRPPARHSAFTALAAFISGGWSIETLIGTLGVHLGFLSVLGLRDRAIGRLFVDGALALLPAAVAIIVMTLAIGVQGAWPDYGAYLQFLSSYNPLAEYWSVVANPIFLGWLPVLLAIFVVWADAWARVFSRRARLADISDAALIYRFVPMAVLLMVQATYFVGRSVPTSLIFAVLPCCAIAIPAGLRVTAALVTAKRPAALLALVPVAIGLWILTFTFLSLFRQESPYSLLLHECRDLDRCSPAAIARGFNETIRQRNALERVRRPKQEGWHEYSGIVRDAMSMMNRWAPNEPAVTVLLGVHASELALMYAGKWDRWPRSYTGTDWMVMSIARRIVAAPVRLREGELVLVRRDETKLGFIEAGILQRIRAETTLCPLPESTNEVIAYRVAGASGCPLG